MEAKELRIGNWVRDDLVNLKDVQIEYIDPKEDFSQLSPIKLTEEWLERFGFVKDKVDDTYYNGEFEILLPVYFKWKESHLYNIKHVHQLQNLFYALTGKELTLTKEVEQILFENK